MQNHAICGVYKLQGSKTTQKLKSSDILQVWRSSSQEASLCRTPATDQTGYLIISAAAITNLA